MEWKYKVKFLGKPELDIVEERLNELKDWELVSVVREYGYFKRAACQNPWYILRSYGDGDWSGEKECDSESHYKHYNLHIFADGALRGYDDGAKPTPSPYSPYETGTEEANLWIEGYRYGRYGLTKEDY